MEYYFVDYAQQYSPNLARAFELQDREDNNRTRTEKGAAAFKSTLKATLDFFGQGGSLRTSNLGRGFFNRRNQPALSDVASKAQDLFAAAYKEDPLTALKIWVYLGDIRGGQGEREVRRSIIRWLAENDPGVLYHNLAHLPIYFRWDDLWIATENTEVEEGVWRFVAHQFLTDLRNQDKGESVSLLAKWLPSENTSSRKTVARARRFLRHINLTPREYRKSLVKLRKHIGVVEQHMSAGDWERIAFENVPSNATFIYRKAFRRHQEERYQLWLDKVKSGESSIKSGTLYPYQIVDQYWTPYGGRHKPDQTLELQWENLPNYLKDDHENSLVICDVSGSMFGGSPSPLTIAMSLTIYTAERNKGFFHDKFLTFSNDSQLLSLKGDTLLQRLTNLSRADWGGTTNLMSAFNKILETAKKFQVAARDMPSTLFIISDMQFDSCITSSSNTDWRSTPNRGLSMTALEAVDKKYQDAGYKRPDIVFWNVRATDNTPVKYNDEGVALVSGFHPSIYASLLGGIETPLHIMAKAVYTERYESITLP